MKTITLEMQLPEDAYWALESAGFDRQSLGDRMRLDLALRLYAEHVLSFGKAAKVAGTSYAEFWDLLVRQGIPVAEYTQEDYERDLETVRALVRESESGG